MVWESTEASRDEPSRGNPECLARFHSDCPLYEASVLVKRPLHGGWLYGYIEPVVRWDRAFRWHPDIGVRIGFDALFWRLVSLPAEVVIYCRQSWSAARLDALRALIDFLKEFR
jgi:hypothetical protein